MSAFTGSLGYQPGQLDSAILKEMAGGVSAGNGLRVSEPTGPPQSAVEERLLALLRQIEETGHVVTNLRDRVAMVMGPDRPTPSTANKEGAGQPVSPIEEALMVATQRVRDIGLTALNVLDRLRL